MRGHLLKGKDKEIVLGTGAQRDRTTRAKEKAKEKVRKETGKDKRVAKAKEKGK